MGENQPGKSYLEGRMDAMLAEIRDIKRHMLGNGRPGILDRVTKNEGNIEKMLEIARANARSNTQLEDTVRELSQAIKAHADHADSHTPKMLIKKDVLAVLVGLIVLVNLLLENGGGIALLLLKLLGLG